MTVLNHSPKLHAELSSQSKNEGSLNQLFISVAQSTVVLVGTIAPLHVDIYYKHLWILTGRKNIFATLLEDCIVA